MWYTTSFSWKIEFNRPLSIKEKNILDWLSDTETDISWYCQREVSNDWLSLEWDWWEKFYDYVEWMEIIMRKYLTPRWVLANGKIQWQGEEIWDIWLINVEDNIVKSIEMTHPGEAIECSHCWESFYLNWQED